MIKGRDGNRGSSSSGYSADLLVCFPSRAHLALTPKAICSPSRPSDSTNRRPHHRRQLSKLSGGGGHGSPVLWAKQASSKNMGGDEIAEPTSPKVTCAGQIKVRSSKCGGKGKNWQSVMEEIERIHSSKSQSKFFGLKKDVMGFLTCLRNIKFDFRCFGDFRHADVTSDDDEEEDDDDDDDEDGEEEEENPKTVFSKWFMVLQEDQGNNDDDKKCVADEKRDIENSDVEPAVPPPNALLLMRCRSAPAKSWLEERMQVKTEQDNREKQREEEEEEEEEEETEDQEMSMKKNKKDLRSLMEEEKMELVLMRYDTEYYKLSSDIAKETWVVGGIQDPLSRSRSWKS